MSAARLRRLAGLSSFREIAKLSVNQIATKACELLEGGVARRRFSPSHADRPINKSAMQLKQLEVRVVDKFTACIESRHERDAKSCNCHFSQHIKACPFIVATHECAQFFA
jgi:hypothetical protein